MIHRRRRRRFRRFATKAILVLIVLVGFWAAGFFVFLDKIPRALPSLELQRKVDAIVVLTGGGGRLELGLRLFMRGDAARLFISGVDPEVDKTALLQNRQVDPTILDCCVTLGHSADDTFGNAAETARWMKSEGLTSVYIVTANYHMPRSMVEFRAALPEAELLPRVVDPSNVHLEDWWRWPGTIRLLTAEYTKYLATRLRAFLSL